MNQESIKTQLQQDLDSSPFNAFCQFQVETADPDSKQLELRMPIREELRRLADSEQFHGGPIAALIDTAGCYACILVLGYGVPTMNFRIDYLRPALGSSLLARARVRKAGRSVALVDIEVIDEEDRLIAVGRGTFSTVAG